MFPRWSAALLTGAAVSTVASRTAVRPDPKRALIVDSFNVMDGENDAGCAASPGRSRRSIRAGRRNSWLGGAAARHWRPLAVCFAGR